MKFVFFFMALIMVTIVRGQKVPAPFVAGDRIVFAGNSITEAGFYGMYIWQYYQLHFPNERITVLNAGVGGDVAGQIADRFEIDIAPLKPTALVLSFGMNDSRYFEYFTQPADSVRREAVTTSFNSFQRIERKLKALPEVRTIMMTSSPFDETRGGTNNKFTGKYKTMEAIAAFQQKAAKQNDWAFVDLMKPMTAINTREQQRDSMFTLTGPDRIHPGNAGHMVMAWLFLKAQQMAGKVVADICVNARKGKLLRSQNSDVTNIKTGAGELAFDYLAGSLPFPADSSARVLENPQKQYEALDIIPFTRDMNQELLTVKGFVKKRQYQVKIDDEEVGRWTGAQLADGINLAVVTSTPQYSQAREVASLNLQYREYEQKLRSYYWLQVNYFKKHDMLFQDNQVAMDSVNVTKEWGVGWKKNDYAEGRKKEVRDGWHKSMQEIIDRIYVINKPVVRRFTISEVK